MVEEIHEYFRDKLDYPVESKDTDYKAAVKFDENVALFYHIRRLLAHWCGSPTDLANTLKRVFFYTQLFLKTVLDLLQQATLPFLF